MDSGGASGRRLLWLAFLPVGLFVLLPTLIVIPMAFNSGRFLEFPPDGISLEWFETVLRSQSWTGAFVTSLRVAAIAVPVALLVGTTAAIAVTRAPAWAKGVLGAVVIAPILVPLIVLSLGDFEVFLQARLVGSVWGLGLAHAVLATPYVFLIVSSALVGLNPALVRAATSLGANWWSVFRAVYLPVLRPGLLAAALLAFIVSFDEAVIAVFLSGPEATTLPVQLFAEIQFRLSPEIAAVSAMLVGIATLALLAQALVLLRASREDKRNRPTPEGIE